MDKMLKAYLDRAAEIIGDRTPSEIKHDDEVVNALNQGHSIEDALAIAARKYPDEAIRVILTTLAHIINTRRSIKRS